MTEETKKVLTEIIEVLDVAIDVNKGHSGYVGGLSYASALVATKRDKPNWRFEPILLPEKED